MRIFTILILFCSLVTAQTEQTTVIRPTEIDDLLRPILTGLYETGHCLAIRQRQLVGSPGSGGSLGFADPTVGVGYAYVTSQMGTRLTDPRDVALRDALYSAITASSCAVGKRVA
jgi:hypothetical protein